MYVFVYLHVYIVLFAAESDNTAGIHRVDGSRVAYCRSACTRGWCVHLACRIRQVKPSYVDFV